MAGTPETNSAIRQERARRADGGEPLHDEQMTIQLSGNSLVIGVTSYAVKTHDIEQGDKPLVQVYPDGIWISTEGHE